MKIPKTTRNNPYIEFKINRNGKVKLSATSNWWGGKRAGFISSDGYEGNTCLPKDLTDYIDSFKSRKIKNIEKEILSLQTQLENYKNI